MFRHYAAPPRSLTQADAMGVSKELFEYIGEPLTPAIKSSIKKSMSMPHGPSEKKKKYEAELTDDYYDLVMSLPSCTMAQEMHQRIIGESLQRAYYRL